MAKRSLPSLHGVGGSDPLPSQGGGRPFAFDGRYTICTTCTYCVFPPCSYSTYQVQIQNDLDFYETASAHL